MILRPLRIEQRVHAIQVCQQSRRVPSVFRRGKGFAIRLRILPSLPQFGIRLKGRAQFLGIGLSTGVGFPGVGGIFPPALPLDLPAVGCT